MKKLLQAMVCLIFLGHQMYGQTGPGGVGNKDGTGGQPENVLWLKANAGISSTGGLVNTWSDQSGNLNHAFGVGVTRPSFVAADATLNNVPSITFPVGGTLHSLTIPDANNLDNGANLTAFYVVRPASAGSFNILSKRSGASIEQSYLFNTTAGPNRFRTQISSGASLISGTFSTATNYFHAAVVAGTAVNGYLNGNLIVTGAAPGTIPNSASDVYIGADGVLDNFEGSVTEVIVYRSALNAAQRQITENYLSAKYNIAFTTVANDVFAGDAPGIGNFDFDLIGIGQQGSATHTEAQASGLLLAPANGTLDINGEFLLAAHRSATNVVSAANLGPGVQQRWSRDWYIDKTGGTLDAFVSFDFSDGIGGNFPQNKDNYVLLRLTAGTYQVVAIPNSSKSILGDRIIFNVPSADLIDGIYTLGTTNLTQSPVAGVSNRTWYSYQSGNWTNPAVWTLDGGVFPLYVNPSSEVPGISDNVIITPGRIITANTNSILINSAQVDGTLDLAATTGHNFVAISGIGRIMMSGATDNFPAGDATFFADAAIGGTVEIYGAGTILSQPHTFNDLEINMNTAASVTTILSNIVLNGDLKILNGLMRFNDNSSTTAKTFTVTGNVTVESSAGIRVGTGNARHEFNLHGNFTNDGTVFFTNRGAANVGAEATDGIVDVNFVSAVQDQSVLLNNTTNFYRIEINKGVDDTYKVSLTASAVTDFNLFGFANDSHGSVAQLATNGNALGLIYGTVEVGSNVVIPILSSTGNYNISAGAQLWVNGGTVNKNNGNAIVPYGKIRLTTGTLTAQVNSGITTRDNGQIIIEGGTLLTNQIRTSVNGIGNVGGYAQSGGDVVVNGDGPGGTAGDYYVFSLTYSGNTFLMSGGTLTVKGAKTGSGGTRGTFLINCDPANVNVTGGTVIFELSNGTNYKVTSSVPLYDVIMRKTAGAATTVLLDGGTADNLGTTVSIQPLVVYNDLRIESGVTFLTNNADVTVGGSYDIENNAFYTAGTNTTTMNGDGVATITFGNTTTTQNFNNLTINKSNGLDEVVVAGGAATALRIAGALRVERGDFDYGSFIVSTRGSVYLADTIGSSTSSGKLLMDGAATQALTSFSGRIHNLEINNTNDVTLSEDLSVLGTLTLTDGTFNIGTHKLTMAGAAATISGSPFSSAKMIQVDGNATDGGLEMYLDANETLLFPIGTNANGTLRYTPASAAFTSFSDEGYVRIRPVDGILQTVNLGGGSAILSYYWRVSVSDFSALPRVIYNFTYAQTDVGGTEANYVSGKVLDDSPFTRSHENNTGEVNDATNVITFNGTGTGFPLEQASYTAGQTNRFTGTIQVFYCAVATGNWNSSSTWSATRGGAGGAGVPGAGDIVVMRRGGSGGYPRGIVTVNTTVNAARVIFDDEQGLVSGCPRLIFPATAAAYASNLGVVEVAPTHQGGVLDGQTHGCVIEYQVSSSYTGAFPDGDFGGFNNYENALVDYSWPGGTTGTVTLSANAREYPQLWFDPVGASSKIFKFPNVDVVVRGRVYVTSGNYVMLNDGNYPAVLNFQKDLAIGSDCCGAGVLLFPGNAAANQTLQVDGNILFSTGGTREIRILNPGTGTNVHKLIAKGNIDVVAAAVLNLGTGSAAQTNVTLELQGTGNHSLTNAGTTTLSRLVMNKGNSQASTFTISDNFSLTGSSNTGTKAIELQNGLLIFDDAAINVDMTTGGGDFEIPASAGLEVRSGTANVSGAATGILLDGLLRVSGGTVSMDGGAGVDNYIEYSASGMATLEVTAGTLTVGSQVRRNLTSTTGVLRYAQSGGSVMIGKNAAPNATRGVFEVLNAGSSFAHTGGSFTMVQGVNSASVPSLWLEPETSNVNAASTITIGNASTPAGVNSQNMGIKSTIALHNLTVAGLGASAPVAKLYIVPLTLNGSLLISPNNSLNAMGMGLNIAGNMQVNGGFIASNNTTTFTGTGSISGTASTLQFYNLTKTGAGILTLAKNVTIDHDLALLGGTFAGGTFTTNLKGNAVVDGTFTNSSGVGLNFIGASQQLLQRTVAGTGTLGIVTIDNNNGVRIPDATGYNFLITTGLRLSRGVFDISSSLLTLGINALITPVNPFSVSNMIQTNSSFTDNGVKKFFPAGFTTNFTFPVGQSLYTPVQFIFSSPGFTSGSSAPSIIVRPANEIHPSVIEDLEAPNPEIVDVNNVLKYHWIINVDNAAGFISDMIMQYDQSLVGVTAPYTEVDYIAARILSDANPSNNIEKFSTLEVNEAANTITFSFNNLTDAGVSGEYFAGIDDAIPDNIRTFTTVRNGNVNEGGVSGVYDAAVPGGGVPNGSAIVIDAGHTLVFNVNDVNLYHTEIRAGGVLEIPAGAIDHRLGTLTGEGTLRIISNSTSAVLPAAYYTDFFACTGGSLNYDGTGSYEIMGSVNTVRNLILEGSGTMTLANNDIAICEDLTIDGPSFRNDVNNRNISIGDDLNVVNTTATGFRTGTGAVTVVGDLDQRGGIFLGSLNSNITVESDLLVSGGTFSPGSGGFVNIGGDLTYSGGTFVGGSGNHVFNFNGTSPQLITGDFTTAPAILFRVEINNSAGVTLGGDVSISSRLILTNGNIFPSTHTFHLLSSSIVLPAQGRSNSYVSGRLYKTLASGLNFTFPIGKDVLWRPASVNATSATRTWSMEYFIGSADQSESIVDNMTPSVTAPPILRISLGEYWKVSDDVSPTSARIGLSWGVESDVSANAAERTALKLVAWNDATSSWDSYGGGSFSAGHSQAFGTFISATALNFSEQIVTLGSTEVANPLPVVFSSFTGNTVARMNHLFWETASEIDNHYFVLERSSDGEIFEAIGRVDAKGSPGRGMSYHYIDEIPQTGRNYYRLKQVDLDDKFEYYDKVVMLNVENMTASELDFSMYPNPTSKNSVTLHIAKGNNEPVHVKVFDLSGRVITETDVQAGNNFSGVEFTFGKTISQGIYMVEISQGYLRKVKRLVINH